MKIFELNLRLPPGQPTLIFFQPPRQSGRLILTDYLNEDLMVNPEKVHGLLRNLEKALEQLRKLAKLKREDFLADLITLGAAKYYLQTAIEACIDIGNHFISSEGYRAPKDYRDIFNILEENGIITKEVGNQVRQLVGCEIV
jgi:uncharacterized protein YutE (UPF0331/DUF86 family)